MSKRKKLRPQDLPPPPANIRVARNRGLGHATLGQWLAQHRRAFAAALQVLRQRPVAALVSMLVVGLALGLPLLLDYGVRNLERIAGALDSERRITVFLKPELSAEQVSAATAAAAALAGVAALETRSPDQAMDELRQLPGFESALDVLDHNPLPYVLLVAPAGAEVPALAASLQTIDGVDEVQHDAQWRERLDRVLALLRRMVLMLAAVLGAGALLLIANAIRTDVMARRQEIGIVSLLGGSDRYVRRPFLYGGLLYGLGGGCAALALVVLVHAGLDDPVRQLAASYASDFRLQGANARTVALALGAGAAVGWIGAFVAATLQLVSDRAR